MFRRERPQAGRYVSFINRWQSFGRRTDFDAEIILLSARLLRRLGLTRTKLMVIPGNTPRPTTPASRAAFATSSSAYFSGHEASLDEEQTAAQGQSAAHTRQQESGHAACIVAGAGQRCSTPWMRSRVLVSRLCALTCRTPIIEYDIPAPPCPRTRLLHPNGFRMDDRCARSPEYRVRRGTLDGLVAQLGGASHAGPRLGPWGSSGRPCSSKSRDWACIATGARLFGAGRGTHEIAVQTAEQLRDALRITPPPRIARQSRGGVSDAIQARVQERASVCRSCWGLRSRPGAWLREGVAARSGAGGCPITQISERLGVCCWVYVRYGEAWQKNIDRLRTNLRLSSTW